MTHTPVAEETYTYTYMHANGTTPSSGGPPLHLDCSGSAKASVARFRKGGWRVFELVAGSQEGIRLHRTGSAGGAEVPMAAFAGVVREVP